MRKSMRTILLCVLAIMMVFVSCSPTAENTEKLGKAILMTDGNARSLTVAEPSFNADELYWKYATQKVDTLEFTTGQTATYDESGAVKVTDGAGLKGKVGPFSQGLWNFRLFAYSDAECTKLAWTGETRNQRIVAGDSNKVVVKVSALQTETGTGTLAIGDILLKDGTSSHAAVSRDNLTQVITYWKEGTAEDQAISRSQAYPDWINEITDIPSGGYWVVVKYVDTAATDIVRGEEKKFVNIFDNVTTGIGGFLSENTGSAIIDGQGDVKKAASNEVPVDTGQPTKLEVAATAESGVSDRKTSVDVPAGVLLADGGKAKVDVTAYTAPKANDMFTVSEGSVAVAGIDLNLSQGGTAKDDFGDQLVTVTTYIAKGLIPGNIDVKYNGTRFTDQPVFLKNDLSLDNESATGYDPVTGELRFQTNHFSQFYIVSPDAVVIDRNTNTVYSDMAEAFAVENADLLLLKDHISDNHPEADSILVRNLTLDLGGKKLTLTGSNERLKVVGKNNTLTINGPGELIGPNHPSNKAVIYVYDGARLVVNGGSYVSYDYMFAAMHNEGNSDDNYITVSDAIINSAEGAVVTNGTDKNMNEITLNSCDVVGRTGYLAGNGIYTFNGGKYQGSDVCIYQKSGVLNVDGVEFSTDRNHEGNEKAEMWYHSHNGYIPCGIPVVVEACWYPSSNPKATINNSTFNPVQGSLPVLVIDWRESESKEYDHADMTGDVPYYYAKVTGHAGRDSAFKFTEENARIVSNWDGKSADESWFSGNAPYYIDSAADLAGLASLVNKGTSFDEKEIVLRTDIDLKNHEWTPIGSIWRKDSKNGIDKKDVTKYFRGIFDGAGHIITNLKVTQDDATINGDGTCIGLFGCVANGELKNLTIGSGSVYNAMDTAAGLVGAINSNSKEDRFDITDCVNYADVNVTHDLDVDTDAGGVSAGILGRHYGDGLGDIRNCKNYGKITGTNGKSAGIVGIESTKTSDILIDSCENHGEINNTWAGAGVLAYNNSRVVIKSCKNYGNITVDGEYRSGYVKDTVQNPWQDDRFAGQLHAFDNTFMPVNPKKNVYIDPETSVYEGKVSVHVKRYSGFKSALDRHATEIVLDADITLKEDLVYDDNIVKLNGHTITGPQV